jgi:hypothetical protein
MDDHNSLVEWISTDLQQLAGKQEAHASQRLMSREEGNEYREGFHAGAVFALSAAISMIDGTLHTSCANHESLSTEEI